MNDTADFSTQEEINAATDRPRGSKGRTPEPLPTYTFKNGAVAHVHHVGQMTMAHVAAGAQKKYPTIPVPTFAVDLGDGIKQEPNPAHPEYQAAVAERNGKVNFAIMEALMEMAVDIEIDHAALDRIKSTLELIGMPLQEISEKVAYIKHCCITDGHEMATLSKLMTGITEEAIEAQTATFPDNLPGSDVEPLQPAVERRELQLSI
jgi:hypothetical protein